jgi:phasin family protein
MFTVDQITAAHKAQFDTVFGLAATAFEGAEKLLALNVATSKALMTEAAGQTAALLEAKDPAALFTLGAAQAQPSMEKASAYGRQAFEIVSDTSAEFTKAAEAQAAQGQQAFNSFVDAALKNAPAGTESFASFFKGAMSAQQSAQAAMQKAVKQASDMAQQSMQAMAAQATQTVKATSAKKR